MVSCLVGFLALSDGSLFGWFLNVLVRNYTNTRVGPCLVGFLTSSSAIRLSRGWVPRLTSGKVASCHTKAECGDDDFCLSRSHYNDTDSTSREKRKSGLKGDNLQGGWSLLYQPYNDHNYHSQRVCEQKSRIAM